jgi:uncharacterized protein (TIGR03083 family)
MSRGAARDMGGDQAGRPPQTSTETIGELGTVYERGRRRIMDLVADLDDRAAATPVPACPAWSVHDVVAHLSGVCADILAGNVAGAATEPWTAAQVDARRERSFGEILAEWDDVGPQVAAFADDFPGRLGNQFITDVTVHEHDLRGTLGRAGSRDSDGVRIGADFLVNVFLHPGVTALGLSPLEVRAGDRNWVVGTGKPPTGDIGGASRAALMSTEVIPEPTVTPVGTLDVEEFALFRALTGPRSCGADPPLRVERGCGALPPRLRPRALHDSLHRPRRMTGNG